MRRKVKIKFIGSVKMVDTSHFCEMIARYMFEKQQRGFDAPLEKKKHQNKWS